jgi:hypothetical protein
MHRVGLPCEVCYDTHFFIEVCLSLLHSPGNTVKTKQYSIFILSHYYYCYLLFVFSGSAAQRWPWPPPPQGFLITHNDTPQSVGLLWTSDQLVAETSILQHTNIHPSAWVRTHDRSRRAAVDRAATGTGIPYYASNVITSATH